MSFHEDYRKKESIVPASEKSFGIVIASALFFIGVLNGKNSFLGISILFFMTSMFLPRILKPLNFLWHHLGLLLHRLMSPVILFILFSLVFVPMGLLMRALGQRPLMMKPDRKLKSYWQNSEKSKFENQF